MFKSFITFYLIYLANGVIFSGFSKKLQTNLSLGCLEIVANKREIYLQKKRNSLKSF